MLNMSIFHCPTHIHQEHSSSFRAMLASFPLHVSPLILMPSSALSPYSISSDTFIPVVPQSLSHCTPSPLLPSCWCSHQCHPLQPMLTHSRKLRTKAPPWPGAPVSVLPAALVQLGLTLCPPSPASLYSLEVGRSRGKLEAEWWLVLTGHCFGPH